jgi:SAM-dependent methyltransferase
LDDPARGAALSETIQSKPALHAWYHEMYERYADCLARASADGIALELGSGGGFARDVVPDLVTSDVLPYEQVDEVVDATAMPFADGTLRFIGMLNVFHHIPDAAAFLGEAGRCLASGGRMLIIDQHRGLISTPVLRYGHHEPFRTDAPDWRFDATGPLSDANGALAWIVFQRDRERLARDHPELELVRYAPHSPLRYWLAGGLKHWSLIGRRGFGGASVVDRGLIGISQALGSFVDIEIVRSERASQEVDQAGGHSTLT